MDYYIVNNASRASNYGIGTYVKQLILALKKFRSLEVTVVDLFSDVSEFTVTTSSKDEICHLCFPRVTSRGIESEAYCKSVCSILAAKIKNSTETVFQFNFFQHYALAFAIKTRFPKVKIVLAIHYLGWCFDLKGNISLFRKIISKYDELTEKELRIKEDYVGSKRFLHLADRIIVLSRFCKSLLEDDYGIARDKIRLVYNGIAPTKSNEVAQQKKYLLPSKGEKIVLYVGRLDEIKGVDHLIKAFSKVLKKDNSLHLYVVGDGNYDCLLNLCEGIWQKVTFTGRITHDALSSITKIACLGVLPSFHEQCSYSAIEFMQNGIPFVGTDSTGLSEMLDCIPEMRVHIDENNFDQDKFVDELATVMRNVIADKGLLRAASKKMSIQFAERYTISAMSLGMKNALTGIKGLPVISEEFLFDLDNIMFSYIDTRPDIDFEFYGMAGIGVYLWWRLTGEKCLSDVNYRLRLQEYLIYYLDWVYSAAFNDGMDSCCNEMRIMLVEMVTIKFYITRVASILKMFNITIIPSDKCEHNEDSIVINAMKIANTKV